MTKHRALIIKVDLLNTSDYIERLTLAVTDGWQRALDIEKCIAQERGAPELFCFKCDRRGTREAAWISVDRIDSETLKVLRIVPTGGHSSLGLTIEQCNALRQDFMEKVLLNVKGSEDCAIPVLLLSDEFRLDRIISTRAYTCLCRFSSAANKGNAAGDSRDRERWNEFLVAVHSSHHHLTSRQLGQWLIEVEQWPEEVAIRLGEQFDDAMSLLAQEHGGKTK